MDIVPAPEAGNTLTPRQYQTRWMGGYDSKAAVGTVVCGPVLAGDEWSLPVDRSFIDANPTALSAPHHNYPRGTSPSPSAPRSTRSTPALSTVSRTGPATATATETAGPLIAKIAETAIVPAEELDVLARAFIAADNGLFWECPPHWFARDSIEIELDVSQISPDGDDTPEDNNDDDDGPTVTRRVVPPALRRWATTRLVTAEVATWSGLLGRARELGGADGGAIIRGLLDMVGSLPPNAVKHIRAVAFQWPRVDVRNAAAERNSQHEGRLTRTSTDSTKPSGVAPGTRWADPRPSLFD